MQQNAKYGSMANAQNAHFASSVPHPARKKVPTAKGEAMLAEFIVGDMPSSPYDIAYLTSVEHLGGNEDLYRPTLALLAALSGLPEGQVMKIKGVGSARLLPDGSAYLKVYL